MYLLLHEMYWSRSDLTVAVDFRITGKPASVGGLKSYFSRRGVEAQGTQGILLSLGATLVANCRCSRLKSLLRVPVNLPAFSAPLREKHDFKPPAQACFPVIRKSTATVR